MDIKPTTNILPPSVSGINPSATNTVSPDLPPNWQLANQVKAIVEKIIGTQLILNINGTQATTPKPASLEVKIGDTLLLQVMQLKPIPQFKVIGTQQAPQISQVQNLINSLQIAVGSQITTQKPMANLLNNIAYVANRPFLKPAPLQPEVSHFLKQVFNNLPAPHDLKTAQQFKLHLQNSGVFLENKMQTLIEQSGVTSPISKTVSDTATLPVNHDLRVQLHRVANIIRQFTNMPPSPAQINTETKPEVVNTYTPASLTQRKNTAQVPTEPGQVNQRLALITQRDDAMQSVLRQIETSINQIQQNQAQSLSETATGRLTWLIDIPVRHGQDIDLFQLKIEEDESGEKQEAGTKSWRVTLNFDLEGLGQVTSLITLINDSVSALFKAENPDTLNLFKDHLELLKSRLRTTGLNVDQLETRQTREISHE